MWLSMRWTAQHPNKDSQQTVEDKTMKFRRNKRTKDKHGSHIGTDDFFLSHKEYIAELHSFIQR